MESKYINGDCMDYLPEYPDNYFDLAIVDPPYGIGIIKTKAGNWGIRKENRGSISTTTTWDFERPPKEYFNELLRVSKNQIIWGGNYFTDFLYPTSCFVVWNKQNGTSYFADCELAWTSFKTATRMFTKTSLQRERIHLTQKPVQLYRWLLQHYAKAGDLILDTHVGSASSLIAFEDMGFDYHGYEKDKDYYNQSLKRLQQSRLQQKLAI